MTTHGPISHRFLSFLAVILHTRLIQLIRYDLETIVQ
jgi:hypothetical protein